MLTAIVLACLVTVLLAGIFVSPFPYWPTYFRLWRCVLFSPGSIAAKRRQCRFLLRAAAVAPLCGLCWLVDEIFYAGYRRQTITPVFIVGQPRSGTTLLHRTMALDRRTFLAVRHLEWRYPFICVQKMFRVFGLDERLCESSYWPDSEAGKLAAKMHPNTLGDWEEDGIFFEENFLHHFFIFLRFPYPDLLSCVDGFPELPEAAQARMLKTHRRVLQKVRYLRGGEPPYYISKEVTSHNKIPALRRLYPDARFIIIAREANDFMASLTQLMRMSTLSKTDVDPVTIPGWEFAVMQRMRNDSNRLVALTLDGIPRDAQVRVHGRTVMEDIAGSIVLIYRELGLDPGRELIVHLERLQADQRVRQRGYEYSHERLQGFVEYDAFVARLAQEYRLKLGQALKESGA